ncbi:hypothetical protein PIB30_089306 [Stylosanthes scabra]|uniref:DUF4283 domain-containing protein n=1 Tax=Stylosanthes scabra TaxID=79078 RepID=A0ABU6XQW5_9FABA|nr:hypothetical protein [Stylosanthes scabra]
MKELGADATMSATAVTQDDGGGAAMMYWWLREEYRTEVVDPSQRVMRGINESARWDASGVKAAFQQGRGINRARNYEEGVFTIFVDNLPNVIFKRDLFKEFGKDGKETWTNEVQHERGKAERLGWRRQHFAGDKKHDKKVKQIWRKVRNKEGGDVLKGDTGNQVMTKEKSIRKEVEARVCESKKDLLKRSPGQIECRDIGPFKCLLTFDSANYRDEAMVNPSLFTVFNEIRPHWDVIWSHSRRVWLEVMGLPVHVWSDETFNSIVKLWGKLVFLDDIMEASMSFSVARFLVGCFEWDRINEWITVKAEGKDFEVYVREFGGEVYSFQAHPSCGDDDDEEESGGSESKSCSIVKETPPEGVEKTERVAGELFKFPNVGHASVNDNAVMGESGCVLEVNASNEQGGCIPKMTIHDDRVDTYVDKWKEGIWACNFVNQ